MLRDYDHSLLGIDPKLSVCNYSFGQFYLVRDSKPLMHLVPRKVPLRAPEYRIIHILSGHVVFKMNMEDYNLEKGSVLLTPPNTIGYFAEFHDDLSLEVLVLPSYIGEMASHSQSILPSDVIHLQLSEKDDQRITKTIDLLEEYVQIGLVSVQENQYSMDCVNHLLLSLTYDLCQMNGLQLKSNTCHTQDREIFGQFLQLINQFGSTERYVKFYAERMNLSSNQLNAKIMEQSGKSVLDWIYQATIMEAKMLLSHTDFLIFEIAAQLRFSESSAFIRFFRSHTGMSPGEYRKREYAPIGFLYSTEASEK